MHPNYETPELLQAAISDYISTNTGKLTITGLAYHLGFESRQSLYEYEQRKEFTYTLRRARMKCENWLERNGLSGNTPPTMAIFALKNYGWSDKQEIEHSGKQEIIYIDKTDSDL